jgi:hypothetical protein
MRVPPCTSTCGDQRKFCIKYIPKEFLADDDARSAGAETLNEFANLKNTYLRADAPVAVL